MSLVETREELVDSIQSNLVGLTVPVSMARIGYELEEAAAWLQALGICNLLIYADTDRFYENLIRSGHTRRYFLRKSIEEGNLSDYQMAISRWDSFLDVLVVGDFSLARDIVSLSVGQWVTTGEYEDDFCYRYFLHHFITPPGAERDRRLEAILERWRRWLGGQDSCRVDCCAALMSRDEAAFTKAFDDRVQLRQSEIARQKKTTLAADIAFGPRSEIFIEGLALLQLALRLGIQVRQDYAMCPAIARLRPVRPLPADMFPEIEAARGRDAP